MKERPIPFSGAMVRALLDGTKTQTRRNINRLAGFGMVTEFGRSDTNGYNWRFRDKRMLWHDIDHARLLECCPYGQPGDRLWVRETFWADATTKKFKWHVNDVFTPDRKLDHCRLIPGIHMPRRTSRILLEITGVRVERLQDISEEDAIAEGVETERCCGVPSDACGTHLGGCCGQPEPVEPIEAYRDLWEQINGPGSWNANPWVWVIEFKRLAG